MLTVKVGGRGQITIPREIRDEIGLQEGQTLALVREGDQIIMRVITETLLNLRGSVQTNGPQDLDAVRQQVISNRADKVVSHDR